MPTTTPLVKVEAVKVLGGDVRLEGTSFEAAEAASKQYLHDNPGTVAIHPFDDPVVIAGQGTIGLEILDELPEASHVFMPVGGGGLLAGIHAAAQCRGKQPRLIGAESELGNAFGQSMQQGKRVRLDKVTTQAEGSAVRQIGKLPFKLLQPASNVSAMSVPEANVLQGMVMLNEHLDYATECTAALGFAAMVQYGVTKGFSPADKVVVVLTGGHRDQARYQAACRLYAHDALPLTKAS